MSGRLWVVAHLLVMDLVTRKTEFHARNKGVFCSFIPGLVIGELQYFFPFQTLHYVIVFLHAFQSC